MLQTIDPMSAKQLIDEGAILVDIREADEFARERIPGARNRPLSDLSRLEAGGANVMIFHCRSGNRTQVNAQRLGAAAGCQAYILQGGLDAWKKAGLPVAVDARQPLEIMRQVQITAGFLVLLGVVLGAWVAPGFYGLSAFVGGGLMFAGLSGWCGMAKMLALMPWNRRGVRAAVA
jgi:rhodanese-related sulfurtransferase